jgi:hypothetical protein
MWKETRRDKVVLSMAGSVALMLLRYACMPMSVGANTATKQQQQGHLGGQLSRRCVQWPSPPKAMQNFAGNQCYLCR